MFEIFHLKDFQKMKTNLQLLPIDRNPSMQASSSVASADALSHVWALPTGSALQVYLTTRRSPREPRSIPVPMLWHGVCLHELHPVSSVPTCEGVNTQLRYPLHWKSS